MNIEKLFGSKTKTDILKYLIFRRQGISMRALEADIGRTFPAVKKQISSLEESGIIAIDKDNNKRAITMYDDVEQVLKSLFLYGLKKELGSILSQYEYVIKNYYFGRIFGYKLETDIVIVYQNCDKELLEVIKSEISELFHQYHIENTYLTFLSAAERQKRYQLADRFVLSILRVHSL